MTLTDPLKQEGRIEGIQQDIQTGEREAPRKITRAIFKKGIPAANILEITGVSVEECPSCQH